MKKLGIGLAALLLLVAAYGAWRVSGLRNFQIVGELVDAVETDSPVVALTFDDGPTPAATDSILAILRRDGVRATFFFTGEEMAQNPQLARRFVEAGHELGNHSYSHQRMVLKSPSFIRRELEATDSLIRAAGHTGPIHFRPPYGKKLLALPWYLHRTGRISVTWDVEPDSYLDVAESSERIIAHVVANARPGSIILLHVMYPSRATSLEAVSGIVSGLRERGYRFATVSELLTIDRPSHEAQR